MPEAVQTQTAVTPPPKAGEVRVDVEKLNGSEADAAEALSGLFADADAPENPAEEAAQVSTEGEASPSEAEQVETPAIGDTEDGHSEQAETPAIEPPVSWTAEAKAQFAKLPPELQTLVATRESEREKYLASQSQKASEETKRHEALMTQIANERAQQAQSFQALQLQLAPELQRFQGIDWAKLAAEKPAEWAQQRQAYEDAVNRWNMAGQQIQIIQQQQQQETAKKHTDFVNEQRGLLLKAIPEFADPVKGKALRDDLVKHVSEFTPEEWGQVADHRYLLVARDAMRWRQQEAARRTAAIKKVQPQPSNVRPLRPTVRTGTTAGEEAKEQRLGALHDNLRRTGSDRAAAALMAASGMFDK